MSFTDSDYYRRRAEQERGMARIAKAPASRAIHLQLASEYEERRAALNPIILMPLRSRAAV